MSVVTEADLRWWVSNLSGAASLALTLYGLGNPHDQRMKLAAAGASFTMSMHNFLLGAHTAAALHLLLMVRNGLSARAMRLAPAQRALTCGAFITLSLALAAATWGGPLSFFLAAGSSVVTFGLFYWAGVRLRLVILGNLLIWLVNAFVYQSLWQMATGALGIGTGLLGIWRIRAGTLTSPLR